MDMLKAVARGIVREKPFEFKVRLGAPIRTEDIGERNYIEMTERVRQAVLQLAIGSSAGTAS
jgi:hypothetical protein